jgi:hypothetical protein
MMTKMLNRKFETFFNSFFVQQRHPHPHHFPDAAQAAARPSPSSLRPKKGAL